MACSVIFSRQSDGETLIVPMNEFAREYARKYYRDASKGAVQSAERNLRKTGRGKTFDIQYGGKQQTATILEVE